MSIRRTAATALIAPGAPVDPARPPVLMYGTSDSGELERGAEFNPDHSC